jgi:hypothetical protein
MVASTIPKPYGDSAEYLNNASLRYTNSMVYAGALSEVTTHHFYIPHLIRRSPLGKLEPEAVQDYKPW